jgi:hypothetical protein
MKYVKYGNYSTPRIIIYLVARCINPLKSDLNPICHLLALVGAHPIFHVSRIRVKVEEKIIS